MPTTRVGLVSLAGLAVLTSCNVGSLFDEPPTKVISVTPTQVVDSATSGNSAQSAMLLIRTATPDAAPEWWARPVAGSPWLTLNRPTGTAPDSLTLTLDPSALAEGVYHDTIEFEPTDHSIARVRVPVELHVFPVPPPPPDPATQLAFTTNPPSLLVLNGTFSVEVTARDAQSQTATGFTDVVTLTLQGPIAVGGLSGQSSVNAVNGIATFTNLKVTGVCTGCSLVASAAGLTSATSTSFNVVGP